MGVLHVVLWLSVPAHEDLEVQIARLTEQIERQPDRAVLYFRRGEVHRLHGDWVEARADLERAAARDPDLAAVDLALGRLGNLSGEPARAREALDRFLRRHPDHGEALIERARARLRLDGLDAALEDYARGLERLERPWPEHYIERSEALRGAGRLDEALRGLEEGLTRIGRVLPLQLAALDLEEEAGRVDAALARIDEIARTAERRDLWLARRGDVLRRAGRASQAAETYRSALAAIDALPAARRRTKFTLDLESKVRAGMEALK